MLSFDARLVLLCKSRCDSRRRLTSCCADTAERSTFPVVVIKHASETCTQPSQLAQGASAPIHVQQIPPTSRLDMNILAVECQPGQLLPESACITAVYRCIRVLIRLSKNTVAPNLARVAMQQLSELPTVFYFQTTGASGPHRVQHFAPQFLILQVARNITATKPCGP